MAINVNEVYQTVLLILNKEQRGYITPNEFNKLATQVQQEIFEQYFEDLNQYLRQPGYQDEYADRVDNIEEKIALFKTTIFSFPEEDKPYIRGSLSPSNIFFCSHPTKESPVRCSGNG